MWCFYLEWASFTHRRREPVKIHVRRVLVTTIGHWLYVKLNVREPLQILTERLTMGPPMRAEDNDGSWIVFGSEGLFRILRELRKCTIRSKPNPGAIH